MNDRFRFRAGFNVSFYDIDGNDIERQIILDSCFSIDNGGEGICVNEEIIQEALDIHVAKDKHKSAWDFINANYDKTDGYYFIDSVDFLEQCTGLKDRNGRLIYEGDIVDIWVVINIQGEIDRRRGKIYWNKEDACFLIYVALDEEYPLYGQDIFIIGNILENKELLKSKE